MSIGLFGAAAIAGVAILVCGRVLRSAIYEMGNPALDKHARIYVGCFALAGVLIILGTSLAAARLANDDDARRRPAPAPDGEVDNIAKVWSKALRDSQT